MFPEVAGVARKKVRTIPVCRRIAMTGDTGIPFVIAPTISKHLSLVIHGNGNKRTITKPNAGVGIHRWETTRRQRSFCRFWRSALSEIGSRFNRYIFRPKRHLTCIVDHQTRNIRVEHCIAHLWNPRSIEDLACRPEILAVERSIAIGVWIVRIGSQRILFRIG